MREKRNQGKKKKGELCTKTEGNVLNDMSAVYQVLGTTEDFKRLLHAEMKSFMASILSLVMESHIWKISFKAT